MKKDNTLSLFKGIDRNCLGRPDIQKKQPEVQSRAWSSGEESTVRSRGLVVNEQPGRKVRMLLNKNGNSNDKTRNTILAKE